MINVTCGSNSHLFDRFGKNVQQQLIRYVLVQIWSEQTLPQTYHSSKKIQMPFRQGALLDIVQRGLKLSN